MPMLRHGFSLGLVPDLLKTGFISLGWLYLGKGEEEEPPLTSGRSCFAHKPGFYLLFSIRCDKRLGEINKKIKKNDLCHQTQPKRA